MTLREMVDDDHEILTFVQDQEVGLTGVIAVHDTTLGPALGGVRVDDYVPDDGVPVYDTEQEAVADILNVSRLMTYKNVMAEVEIDGEPVAFGGGKAAIVRDPDELGSVADGDEDAMALFETFAERVDTFDGTYVTAEDRNTHTADMDLVAGVTDHVVGRSVFGDPSPITAQGVAHGIQASLEHVYGDDSLEGRTVLVQGAGKVGRPLVTEHLVPLGAEVTVAEPDESKREKLMAEASELHGSDHGVEFVDDHMDPYDEQCDVFAPCAIAGLVNADTIPRLECDVVAGCANNQLGGEDEEHEHAGMLQERDVLYAPDFVINAGGVINVSFEYRLFNEDPEGLFADWEPAPDDLGDMEAQFAALTDEQQAAIEDAREKARTETRRIRTRLETIYEEAEGTERTPLEVAYERAEQKLDEARSG